MRSTTARYEQSAVATRISVKQRCMLSTRAYSIRSGNMIAIEKTYGWSREKLDNVLYIACAVNGGRFLNQLVKSKSALRWFLRV